MAGADPPQYPKLSWPFLLLSADFDGQNADLLIRKEAGSVHSACKPEKHHYNQIIGKKTNMYLENVSTGECFTLHNKFFELREEDGLRFTK